MILWAVLAAGIAAWWLMRPAAPTLVGRLATTPPVLRAPRPGRWRWLLPIGALAALAGFWSAAGAWLMVVGLVGGSITYLASRRRAEAKALASTREVARACRVLDALLRQGHVPVQALIRTAQECPLLAPAGAVAQMGGDVMPVLKELGAQPGAAGLLEVARAWEVTRRTGAPLHGVLVRVKDHVVSQADLTAVIAQELAAPRATSQLLAALPMAGLGLGYVIGGDPVAFFTTTGPGRLCLMAGVALACVGVLWSEALARRASVLADPTQARRSRRQRSPDSLGQSPSLRAFPVGSRTATPRSGQPLNCRRRRNTSPVPQSTPARATRDRLGLGRLSTSAAPDGVRGSSR